ncbi:MAG: iron-containing alcohol dehydrogenase [Nanoarchaeota archaeon]|nr:iron-containing alcohol dehydrogenase [Nanoarchaeota archaeon]
MSVINQTNRLFGMLKKGFFPRMILLGPLQNYLKTLDKKDCFIVASKTVLEAKKEMLKAGLEFEDEDVFTFQGEPTNIILEDCMTAYSKKTYSFIFAIGGGSVIDLAKALKSKTSSELVVVPTTPGTGSEVTTFAIITDENNVKQVLNGEELMPDAVILDKTFLMSLPKETLGVMIFDILGHAMEARVSKFSNPFSDNFAEQAIRIIMRGLGNAVLDKEEYLEQIQIAGVLAGSAQGIAYTGLAHGFAHQIGPVLKIGHAKAVSIFLKDVMELNIANSEAGKKIKKGWIDNLDKIYSLFGLEKVQLKLENKDELAEKIQKDICTRTNPFRPTPDQILEILNKHEI